jgi:AcrR family transcriptional regulator
MPRPNVSEERKAQIIQAATEVFSKQGLANTRMDDIAAAANLSKGTLYLYYKSKEELTTAIIEQIFTPNLEYLQQIEADSSLSQLNAFAHHIIMSFEQFTDIYPLILEFYATREPSQRDLLNQYFTQYREALSSMIKQGIASGEINSVDSVQTAISLTALFEGTALLKMINPSLFDFRTQCLTHLNLLLEGLKA